MRARDQHRVVVADALAQERRQADHAVAVGDLDPRKRGCGGGVRLGELQRVVGDEPAGRGERLQDRGGAGQARAQRGDRGPVVDDQHPSTAALAHARLEGRGSQPMVGGGQGGGVAFHEQGAVALLQGHRAGQARAAELEVGQPHRRLVDHPQAGGP